MPGAPDFAASALAGVAATAGAGALAAAQFARDVTAQLPLAAAELERGARDFDPTPDVSRSIIREGYRVPATLLVRYTDDSIDETPEMEQLLRAAIDDDGTARVVERIDLEGNHASACGPAAFFDGAAPAPAAFTPIDAIGMAATNLAGADARRTAAEVGIFLERALIR